MHFHILFRGMKFSVYFNKNKFRVCTLKLVLTTGDWTVLVFSLIKIHNKSITVSFLFETKTLGSHIFIEPHQKFDRFDLAFPLRIPSKMKTLYGLWNLHNPPERNQYLKNKEIGMGCLFGCFGSSKDRKRRKRRNNGSPRRQVSYLTLNRWMVIFFPFLFHLFGCQENERNCLLSALNIFKIQNLHNASVILSCDSIGF